MQPYFYPYIGYFQLMNVVDVFVLYDDIQYVKQSWINRNRILINGESSYISIPLKKASDYLHVKDRRLAATWDKDSLKLARKLAAAYSKAPYFKEIYEPLEKAIANGETNLFNFLFENLLGVKELLSIDTKLVVSSEIGDFTALQSQDKVIAICEALGASQYINPIGGIDLYNKNDFSRRGMELTFIRSIPEEYTQFRKPFQPFLSIIDVLMFNSIEQVKELINTSYEFE
ncbi:MULTISPECIES: WbqC family protein [unclassified Marinobacterium]|uniref:WbqC family protein n=1 Tax=unclassified Marinobacterium TaxID=2644139 RepID=UPI001A0AEFBE|nr:MULTISPECIES: WbqC family protein [unclassified Marinobacterium]NRP53628.1 WbqC-like protein family protein [Marinobacterium sp. xm-v-242]NRP77878.1 WbqC-like protein family protein [Marinobacterium sp. xm-m-383]